MPLEPTLKQNLRLTEEDLFLRQGAVRTAVGACQKQRGAQSAPHEPVNPGALRARRNLVNGRAANLVALNLRGSFNHLGKGLQYIRVS
jgi:hypothetical protein